MKRKMPLPRLHTVLNFALGKQLLFGVHGAALTVHDRVSPVHVFFRSVRDEAGAEDVCWQGSSKGYS